MDIENLVEKITREVMDSMKTSGATSPTAPPSYSPAPSSNAGLKNAVLLAGSPNACASSIEAAISTLRMRGLNVSLATSDTAVKTPGGVTPIRCRTFADCASAVRNADKVVLLMNDVATMSRMANLLADRFDVEGALYAIEAGKEVLAVKPAKNFPRALIAKVDGFVREIENFGIRVIEFNAAASGFTAPAVRAGSVSPSSSSCPATGGAECAGCGFCANLITDKVKDVVDEGAERISAAQGIAPVPADLAKYIDHTLLKADATRDQVLKLCEEARQYKFASCCVNPTWVPTVAECLKGSTVKTCVVIGFPLGANSSMIKAMETRDAVAAGADEVDMVINVGALKAGDYDLVRHDIEAVVEAAQGRIVKVILETALLTDDEKIKACQLSKQAGADFVKTSTGFGPGGATAEDIALMRQTVGKYMGVKASGGIRDFTKAQQMIKAGATRIGASASIAIVKGVTSKGGGY